MALIDVSKTITLFQRLCQFAEEFTREHREPLVEALTSLFLSDLQEGQQAPDVKEMIDGFVRRLRRTLENMTLAETELLGAFKANIAFRDLRDQLMSELRVVFDRARTECRNHFGRKKSDAAGFPARIADDPGALLRQTKLVSWTLRKPEFDLGDSVIPDSTTTAESILKIYEPKVQELDSALSDAVRRRARARGKQVAKDKEVTDFRTTYSLFINLIRSSFSLAGQTELARWVALNQPRRSRPSAASDDTTTSDTASSGTVSSDTAQSDSSSPKDSGDTTDPSEDPASSGSDHG